MAAITNTFDLENDLDIDRTRLKGGETKKSELWASVFECPICTDVSLPIFQCSNGHIICKVCWESLVAKTCPTCRIVLTEPTRNRALEQVVQNLDFKFACKFAANGCPEKMTFAQKEAHQLVCMFRSYGCPLLATGCKWSGCLTEIADHLKGRKRCSHAVPIHYGESATVYFPVHPDETEEEAHVAVQMQYCLDSFFLIVLGRKRIVSSEHDSDDHCVEYTALVQCLGLKDEASQFAYRLELEQDGKRLSWEAVPISISQEIKEVLDKGDCLCFNHKTMTLFKPQDSDMIHVDVTINKIVR